jgi:hypothetical protein
MAEAKIQKQTFEAESVKLAERQVSRVYLVSLANGQAIQLVKQKIFNKLMICYASIVVGTKKVSVNN